MSFLNLIGKSDKAISELSQPFVKDCVTSINIEIAKTPSIFREGKKCKATIWFKKGNTSGNHDVYDDDFQTLMTRIKSVIESL